MALLAYPVARLSERSLLRVAVPREPRFEVCVACCARLAHRRLASLEGNDVASSRRAFGSTSRYLSRRSRALFSPAEPSAWGELAVPIERRAHMRFFFLFFLNLRSGEITR